MLDAKLVIVAGADTELDYELQLPVTIGRSRENDIALPHPLVSRRHCELLERNGRLLVRDLGSLNGTFVGNKPVNSEAELAPGQLLTVGTVTFRALYADYEMSDALDDVESDPNASTVHGETVRADGLTTRVAPRHGLDVNGKPDRAVAAEDDSQMTVRAPRVLRR